VAFYGYLCWLGFWFIRGTHGRERAVIVGWAIEILGLAVSLFAAVSLLFHPSAHDSDRKPHIA
jgi:hypothetical protein